MNQLLSMIQLPIITKKSQDPSRCLMKQKNNFVSILEKNNNQVI